MSHDANRAVSLADLVVTAVIGALGDELAKKFAELRADQAHLRLELERLNARAPRQGEPGPPGPPGPAAERGPEGPPGRDAHYIRPIPWRAGGHARGTVVEHVGGIWEALAPTDAEPGSALAAWALILDSPEPERVEPDPDGTLALVFRRASGTEQRLRFWRPGGWAGVWDIDANYGVNDSVTHDGSVWLAVSSSKGERPGSSSVTAEGKTRAAAWRLIVKRGRDGRDGVDGVDGEPGRNGRDGAAGAAGDQGTPGLPGPAGAPGKDGESIRFRSDYGDQTRYAPGDIVRFGSALYVAREAGILGAPGRAAGRTHWALLFDVARIVREGKP